MEPKNPLRRRSTSLLAAGLEFRTNLGPIRHEDVASLSITYHQAVFQLGQGSNQVEGRRGTARSLRSRLKLSASKF